jgi:hypothetical protein
MGLDRTLHSQRLFDEGRDALAVLTQHCLDLGMFCDDPQREAEQLCGGFLSSREHESDSPRKNDTQLRLNPDDTT